MATTNPSDVLTLAEAAKLLRVSERTAWQLAKSGVLPAARVGSQYRFMRPTLMRWLDGQTQKIDKEK